MKLIYFINLNWKFFKRQCVTFQKKSKNYSEAKKGRGAYTLCFLLSISMYLWGCKIKIWIKWNSSKATEVCHALTHCTILTRFPLVHSPLWCLWHLPLIQLSPNDDQITYLLFIWPTTKYCGKLCTNPPTPNWTLVHPHV